MQSSNPSTFRNVLFFMASLLIVINSHGQSKRFLFQCIAYPVIDEYTGESVFNVQVLCYAADKVTPDTLKTSGGMRNGERISTLSLFNFKEGLYRFVLSHPNYEDYEFTTTVKYYNREESRWEKPIYMKRRQKERKLQEVTVNATLVKFYTKKDTLIYNADAFLTAQGSMLDGLIRQLPGVEMRDNGQIYVNGEYVESLLLNGDDFFKQNKRIMLENLPAYMVKDIKVYKREENALLRMMGNESGHKSLVMDVNLKKQYAIGWIANTEWGAGTNHRYLGRLFANRFTPGSRITIVGNLNNVNDNRKPGEADDWSPDKMPKGILTTQSGQLEYKFKKIDGKYDIGGNVDVTHTDANNQTVYNQENFLQSGNTYERSAYGERTRNTQVTTRQDWMQKLGDNLAFYLNPNGGYKYSRQNSSTAGGAFSEDPSQYIADGLIDSLYMPISGSILRPILINKLLKQSSQTHTQWDVYGRTGFYYKFLTQKILPLSGLEAREATAKANYSATICWTILQTPHKRKTFATNILT